MPSFDLYIFFLVSKAFYLIPELKLKKGTTDLSYKLILWILKFDFAIGVPLGICDRFHSCKNVTKWVRNGS